MPLPIVPTPISEATPGSIHPKQGAFSPRRSTQWAKAAFGLGARLEVENEKSYATFAVFSKHATKVILEIYAQPLGEKARYEYSMSKGQDGIWRAQLENVPLGTYYGYRCWGPNWIYDPQWKRGNSRAGFLCDVDGAGNRFNPNKLLIDPYAKEFSHDRETPEMKDHFQQDASMYGSGPGNYSGIANRLLEVPRREFDTGPWAPKAVLIQDQSSFGKKPHVAQKDAIIYETHVKGLTRHPSVTRLSDILRGIPGFESVVDIPDALRGTYAGAAYMAKYLKALGYTAVEFLPVHEFANDLNPEDFPGWDRHFDEPPHGNYWGYMTYGFFAPDLRYAHDKTPGGPTREFKNMVKTFHEEGLEVYLDVVYNHTGEGGLWDASGDTAEILSFRGLDNAEYYALTGGNRFYWESTGCGNNFDASKSVVQNLIKDSLRYWSLEMGVDGFRFDLATVLGRIGPNHDFDASSGLLKEISTFAEKERIEIMAEAWDLGGYHVGDFPRGWAEWNGVFRDSVRRFMKGDGNAKSFIQSLNGDYAHFQDQGGPHKSVNFLTAHDGFTLLDLVSYNGKNNAGPWPFGPSDGGSDDNLSWDSGGQQALRRQRLRNFLVVQFFARGVPMTCGGDEFARTQNGNNNPYKLDSIGIWQNYAMIATPAPNAVFPGGPGMYHDNYGRDAGTTGKNGLFLFLYNLIRLRKSHASLRQNKFADLQLNQGGDVTFLFKTENGLGDLQGHENRIFWHIDGSGIGCEDFLVLINMHHAGIEFTIPPPGAGKKWIRLIDTATWAEPSGNFWLSEKADVMGKKYIVNSRSVVVFKEVQ
jgi:glycogen operon protein